MGETVFILTAEPPESGGGVEHFVRELCRGLEARGYRIKVFDRANSEPQWLSRRTGRFGKKLAGTLRSYWIGRNAQNHMNEDVTAVISNSDVGLYPLHSPNALRQIHFYHGTFRAQAEAIRPFIKFGGYLYMKWWGSMALERLSGRNKLVLCNSDQTCDEVCRFFGLNSVPVWLPIDTERFNPGDAAGARTASNFSKDVPIGLFVGSTHPMKGFPVVKSLMDRVPEVHWVLALRGGASFATADGSNVTILRDVPHHELPGLYRSAAFSVCPSLYEPFGYVVAESLMCGTPVIAAPGGASRAFLRDTPLDGLLVQGSDSVERYVTAIRNILRSPEFYRQKVQELARPRLIELMASDNWWRKFFGVTGL